MSYPYSAVVLRVPPPLLAVRCALFSVDGRVGCFSCLERIWSVFLWGFTCERASERASDAADAKT